MKEQLKEYRKSLGLTQAQFAEILGYRREVTIADYETGQRAIPKFLQTIVNYNINPLTSARVELFKLYEHVSEVIKRFETERDYDELSKQELKEQKEMLKLLDNMFDQIRGVSFFQEPQ